MADRFCMTDYWGPAISYDIIVTDKENNKWQCEPIYTPRAFYIYGNMCEKVKALEIKKVVLTKSEHNIDDGSVIKVTKHVCSIDEEYVITQEGDKVCLL